MGQLKPGRIEPQIMNENKGVYHVHMNFSCIYHAYELIKFITKI
jgi:hypothetical protein